MSWAALAPLASCTFSVNARPTQSLDVLNQSLKVLGSTSSGSRPAEQATVALTSHGFTPAGISFTPSALAIDADVGTRTANLSAHLQRAGKRIEWADLVIAATALVHGLIVVTRNVRHFDRIDGLQVENWFPTE